MKRLITGAFIGLLCSTLTLFATQGVAPPAGGGMRLLDADYVLGIANGTNLSFTSGISAAGTTQATATQLAGGFNLVEIDTVGASSGVALPFCLAGTQMNIYNNTATTLTVYPAILNNPITAAQDTINNSTSYSLSAHTGISPACAKNGVWGAW